MFTRPGRPHLSRGICNLGYPLVNVYITMERSTMLLMGKSTISMAIFNSFLYVYQAGYPCYKLVPNPRARALNPRSFPVGHRQFWLNLGWWMATGEWQWDVIAARTSRRYTAWWWLEPWNFEWLSMKSWEFYRSQLVRVVHHFSEG
jgi:hypothetical protein